ncbi:MAG: hypothetical protein Q8918_14395 [Bacteroidota bacterium]|nr:hypothetical protein [Bacteroidota bacterium]MDP4214412.1 hypothetical protein [Bacteroidota bacterium]MDP4251292.1 hypothetical protein [Bacteroidota bacterium]
MKYIIPGMLCMLLALSCTRTNEQTAPTPNASTAVLDSAYFYSTGPKEIVYSATRFNYDAQGRFTGTYATFTDSTIDHHLGAPADTGTLVLSYNGMDALPATYQYQEQKNYFPPSLLSYDNQNRVILDSPVNPIYTVHFTYGNSYVSWTGNYIAGDTIFIDNHNISRYFDYFEGQTTYSYSSYPNPYYLPKLAGNVGIALVNNGTSFDLISKNLFSKKVHSGYSKTYNYNWTLNANGQVVSGIGTDQDTGQPVEYYQFVYKK